MAEMSFKEAFGIVGTEVAKHQAWATIQAALKEAANAEAYLEHHKEAMATCQAELARLEKDMASKEQTIAGLIEDITALEKQSQEARADSRKKIAAAKDDYAQELAKLKADYDETVGRYSAQTTEHLEALQTQIDATTAEADQAEMRLASAQEALKAIKEQIQWQ